MLEVGRARLPVVIDAEPLAPNDADAVFVHAQTDVAGFHRMWAAALFHRALDGYDASLLLWKSHLDTEARAHCRIAFEHLVSFAWVVADPADIERPQRIIRYGFNFAAKQFREMARYATLSDQQLNELGLALHVNANDLRRPPSLPDLCKLLDAQAIPGLDRIGESFSAWYSHLYRGASAFVHPTAAGIQPLITPMPGAFQVAPSRLRAPRVAEIIGGHLVALLLIANWGANWLVEGYMPDEL